MSDAPRRYAVFLSHNGRDKELIEPLAYKLRDAGLYPWFDKWEQIPGKRWIGGLAEGLRVSATCAVFIGLHNLGDWEAEEIDLAHTRAANDAAFRVIPILLPGVPDPFDPNSLPPFLRTRTWVDFRKGFDDERAFYILQCGINGIAPGPESGSDQREDSPVSTQDGCPYRGLQVFNEEDAGLFFGRAGDVQRLVEKLKATRFLGVLGASGSGKSSLVRAGLIPALREGELPGSVTWQRVPIFPPGSAPLESLILNFARLPGVDTSGLLKLLRDSECALDAAVHNFLELPAQKNAGTQRVLLVVDQLEELFTLCDKENDRAQFLANLNHAGSAPDGRCVVVVTLRADFYHKFAAYPEFSAALAAQQFLVSPLPYEGLVQVIQEPARAVNLAFEPGLIEAIVDDVARQPGALPLLEYALLELWKRRRNGQLTLEAYIDTGRVKGAIAQRADAIYDSFSPAEQTTMRRMMLRLTRLGEGTEDIRRRASLDELITHAEERATVERVIDTLTKPEHRLLTTDAQTGTPVIEVSHEAMIRGWDRLQQWLDENREGKRLHERLSDTAKEWQAQAKAGASDEGLLYRGLVLARASEWRKQNEADLNETEREFLNASEALKQRREAEKQAQEQHELETAQKLAIAAQEQAAIERKARVEQRYSTIAMSTLFLVALVLSFYVYQQSKVARSREIAGKTATIMSTDPLLAVLLAIEATKISPTTQAETALRDSLIAAYGLENDFRGHTGAVTSAAFSADGRYVVTASRDKTARVWEVASGQIVLELKGHTDAVTRAAFSADGKSVVTVSFDGTARMWEVASGKKVLELKGPTNFVTSAAFSADGKSVVTASLDNTACVWEVARGKKVLELKDLTNSVTSAAFSADGKYVVTASRDKTAYVWEVASGRLVCELKGHTGAVTSAAFSADGKSVVTASVDQTACVWEMASGRSMVVLKGHTGSVYSAAFSADGKSVVTASLDNTACVWEVARGKKVLELKGHTDAVTSAAFSADGKYVVTASEDGTARKWEVVSGRTSMVLEGSTNFVTSAAFSADGKYMVTASLDNTARVGEVASGRPVMVLEGHTDAVASAAFSADSKYVVTASRDKTACVWEIASKKKVRELKGHTGAVTRAAFSADGKYVVTASDDRTARVWEMASGRLVMVLEGHTGPVYSAAFSADGKSVVTASLDITVRIFDCAELGNLDSLLELAKQRVHRQLTEEERRQYLEN